MPQVPHWRTRQFPHVRADKPANKGTYWPQEPDSTGELVPEVRRSFHGHEERGIYAKYAPVVAAECILDQALPLELKEYVIYESIRATFNSP